MRQHHHYPEESFGEEEQSKKSRWVVMMWRNRESVEKVSGLDGTSESFQARTSGTREDAHAFQVAMPVKRESWIRIRVHKKKKDE